MATTHPNATRDDVCNFVVDKVDLGTTNPAGKFVFLTSALAIVASINLLNPAFGASVNGTANALGLPLEDTNAVGGLTTICQIRDRDENQIVDGEVGTTGSGLEVELTDNNIPPGATVRLNGLSYTAMP